jgi:hypothetical protein
VESKNMPISGDARRLDMMLRQTSEMWKVAIFLRDVPTICVASQQAETRASFAHGGAPALPNRMHNDCEAVRQQSADSLLRAQPQG